MGTAVRCSFQPGQVFAGRYRIVGPLGKGGMGAVYEVRHHQTEAVLALKVMLPGREVDATLRERFRLEWNLTANIQGEHIARAVDAGFDEETGTPFLVMERLEGEDLGARVARGGPLPAVEVVQLLEQLARALSRIHAAGVVHRDIKPSNLFVTKRDDGTPLLKVLDFGIAKVIVETTRTIEPTLVMGSPPYMPPEQLEGDGDIGTAADLYAFAQVAFTLLVGSAYWRDEHERNGVGGLRRAVRQGLPEPASVRAGQRGVSLPLAFDAWFSKATAVDADDRPASPIDLVRELSSALGLEAGAATSPATSVTMRPPPRRTPRSMLVGLVAAAVVAALLVSSGVLRHEASLAAPRASSAAAPTLTAPLAPPSPVSVPPTVASTGLSSIGSAGPAAPGVRKVGSAAPKIAASPKVALSSPSSPGPAKPPDPIGDGVQ